MNIVKKDPFWKSKSLLEMTHDEWESICDGCAKCCLQQLIDEDTEQLVFTDVACELLDGSSCRCADYQNRTTAVPSCMALNRDNVYACAEFAPSSCAYRLLLEGKDLPSWHHLVSGRKNTVHETGNSVKDRVRKENDIDITELENYVVDWP